jgi:hypothetical protein
VGYVVASLRDFKPEKKRHAKFGLIALFCKKDFQGGIAAILR